MTDSRKVFIFFLALSVFIFVLHPRKTGFEPGHHGWVTAQHLAIIQNAGVENYFVGYTGDYLDEHGKHYHFYFDRAPFLIESAMHYLLQPLRDDLPAYVYWGRQLFNIIFFMTLYFAYRFLLLLTGKRWQSIAAVLFVFSSFFLMHYKDLVEQNRLGTLALILIFWAIARYEKSKNWKELFLFVATASMMGEAAPSTFILGTWVLVRMFSSFFRGGISISTFRRVTFSVPVAATVLSVVLVFSFLFYNVWAESKVRNISIMESGIVDSASRRLASQGGYKGQEKFSWSYYGKRTGERFVRSFIPFAFYSKPEKALPSSAATVYLIILISYIIFRRKNLREAVKTEFPEAVATALLGGFVYLIVMKNLASPHGFIATYMVGFYLLFFSVVSRQSATDREDKIKFGVAILVFAASLMWHNLYHSRVADEVNIETKAAQAANKVLPDNTILFFEGGDEKFFEGAPNAPVFYFQNHLVAITIDYADYVITRSERYKGISRISPDYPWSLVPVNEYKSLKPEN